MYSLKIEWNKLQILNLLLKRTMDLSPLAEPMHCASHIFKIKMKQNLELTIQIKVAILINDRFSHNSRLCNVIINKTNTNKIYNS